MMEHGLILTLILNYLNNRIKKMKKLLLTIFISLTFLSGTANAHWFNDGYGYVSNVCRAGAMWQVVPYHYIGTDCYMPGWGIWGKRTME